MGSGAWTATGVQLPMARAVERGPKTEAARSAEAKPTLAQEGREEYILKMPFLE